MKFNKLFFVLLALTLISMASLVKIRRTEAEAATETDAEAERKKRKENGAATTNNAGNNSKTENLYTANCLTNSKLNTKEECKQFEVCFADGVLKTEFTEEADRKKCVNSQANNAKTNNNAKPAANNNAQPPAAKK